MQTLDRGISAPQQVVGRCRDASLIHQPPGTGPMGFSGFVGVANILGSIKGKWAGDKWPWKREKICLSDIGGTTR
jgi:hypothetical protein